MPDKIIMGYWDCPFCDSKGIPGTTYDCPNCGKQRGEETRFYMRSKVDYVPGHKVEGADWFCEYCGSLNKAGSDTCENCGSRKDESKDDYFSMKKKTEARKQEDKPKEEPKPKPKPVPKPKRTKAYYMRKLKMAMFALIAIMLILFLRNAAKAKDYTYDVQSLSWENTIEVEELKTFREDGWSLPSNARLVYTNLEVKSYDSVLDHYETVTKSRQVQSGGHYESSYTDNGDGTFTEHQNYVPDYTTEYYTEEEPVYVQVPVYDTKYYYDIDKWVTKRTEVTSGTDKNPTWKNVSYGEKEREANRTSEYTMEGVLYYKTLGFNRKKNVAYKISESAWQELEPGQTVTVTLQEGKLQGIKTN